MKQEKGRGRMRVREMYSIDYREEQFSLLNTSICSRSEARVYIYLLNKLYLFSSRGPVSSLLLTRIGEFVLYRTTFRALATCYTKSVFMLGFFNKNRPFIGSFF